MIQVENSLLSEEIFSKHFVCDLQACKGACCIEGDSGAPLEIEEIDKLEEIYDDIKDFLTEEGRASIEKNGVFNVDRDAEFVTTLNQGKECAFTTYNSQGHAKCGIEDAYRAGKTDFKKPISCELYPIRIDKLKYYEALNYHRWEICKAACDCGAKLKVKVYQFLKEPLIRKYGEEWYEQLKEVDKLLEEEIRG